MPDVFEVLGAAHREVEWLLERLQAMIGGAAEASAERQPHGPREPAMIRLLYRPVGMLVSVLGGLLASAISRRVWKDAAHEEDAPEATDASRGWREILLATAIQGAIFAVVKAVVDRSAAEDTRKLTCFWPGDEDQ